MFQKKSCREDQNKHFRFNKFFVENHGVYEIMWKNNVDTVRKHENMALARYMLDIYGYKYTLRI